MTNITTKPDSLQPAAEMAVDLFDSWFDPIETEVRARAREFVEELIRGELDAVLARPRYGRSQMAGNEARAGVAGHRHGSRTRSLTGTFGPIEIAVPRARLNTPEGKTAEWKSQALRAYQRRTLAADALIASTYLAGTNTRRVRRALAALFGGAVGKDTVSRTWRKVKSDWDAWSTRSLAEEPIVRLILDGTVVRVRLDRKATSISLLVVLGVRADGQKVLLAIKSMGGESAEAWRTVLDDLIKRGLRRPEFLIVDGALGLDKAIAAVWDGVPVQRCTVHKHRNLLAHAPERLHDEITADYNDMIYAATRDEIEARRKAFIRKWRLNTVPSPTAWRKPATGCSPSPVCRRASGAAHGLRMRSSDCTRSSSEGSRRRPCCRLQTPLPCCSGRYLHPVRSTCARLMVGRRSPQSPLIS
jgi:putative transposase